MNEVISSTEARKRMKLGVDTLANAVKATLGAKGRNVIIYKDFDVPHATKDGVTVAKEILPKDKLEFMGAALVKQAASETADLAGDGTTSATVLSQSMITEGLKLVEAGSNPMDLKRGIDKAVVNAVELIKKYSKEVAVSDEETLINIATVSANNDVEIGSVVADVYKKVGKDGVVEVDFGKSSKIEIEISEGIEIDKGYSSPFFMTNEKEECVLEDAVILLHDDKIQTFKDLLNIVTFVAQNNKSLLIFSQSLEGEALAVLVANKMKGTLKVASVNLPEYAMNKIPLLEDIGTVTGGKIVSKEMGTKLESADVSLLGKAEKVVITKNKCTIIGGGGDKENIKKRAEIIKTQIEEATEEYEIRRLKERYNKLVNGVALIKVGGFTESEIKEKKDRVDDAVCATKAALEEGFVAGGGVTFLRILNDLNIDAANQDEALGLKIVKSALLEPFKQILSNGGINYGDWKRQVLEADYGYGYNVKTDTFENFFETGIIDPTKVLRVSLENSASVAGVFLTTEATIIPTTN